jgi:hypothetical protein
MVAGLGSNSAGYRRELLLESKMIRSNSAGYRRELLLEQDDSRCCNYRANNSARDEYERMLLDQAVIHYCYYFYLG